MPQPDRKKQVGVLLIVLLALGLVTYAVLHVLRWQQGPGKTEDGLTLTKVSLSQAPPAVQDAALQLRESRIGYVIPQGNMAYVIVSTGVGGEPVELAGAKKAGAMIDVDVRSSGNGASLAVGLIKAPILDTRYVQFYLDGYPAAIPSLVNGHALPLTALPQKDAFAVISPREGERVTGSHVEVSGYARIFEGQFSITVFSAGKGRVLGELKNVAAATGAPNWGSFRTMVPIQVPAGVTDGVVLIFDEQTGAKALVPVVFGSK